VNRNLKELIELSKIDKEIDGYNPQIEAIDKKLLKSQQKLDVIQDEINSMNTSIEDNHRKIKMFEEQITSLSEQLNNNAKKAKDVSTEKEMKALSLEEDIAKEKMSFANEEIERIGKINEKKSATLEELENELKALQETQKESNKSAIEQKEAIENSKSNLFSKREECSEGLEQKILAFYEKIRLWAGNTAVVPVRKQACYGCYMKISDKAYADVIKSEEIITCPHCGRILYIEKETTQQAEA
jgi:uncharacterized protein